MTAVLDTNVWIAILVFEDPRTELLAQALAGERLRAIASPRMREELERVLTRPAMRVDALRRQAIMARFDALTNRRNRDPGPDSTADMRAPAPRCRDPDDQVFVDVALAEACGWLISRDREVLALARAAARFGLSVCAPEAPALRLALRPGRISTQNASPGAGISAGEPTDAETGARAGTTPRAGSPLDVAGTARGRTPKREA